MSIFSFTNNKLHPTFDCSLLVMFLVFFVPSAYSLTYHMPSFRDSVVGSIRIVHTQKRDNLYKIARRYEMGFSEMHKANPTTKKDRILPEHTPLIVPGMFVLPHMAHQNILVNLPELRLYYFPKNTRIVITEPVSVGRPKWETPLMSTKVVEKIRDPYWLVPESIQYYSARKGTLLPTVVPPGAANPLGQFALRLGKFSILIHGTNQPFHIGKRISSGCIRMYPEDIAHLFHKVPKNTPVFTINQPYKVGFLNHRLYLEVHTPLEEYQGSPQAEQDEVHSLVQATIQNKSVLIDWHTVNNAVREHKGIPIQIGEER